MFLFSRNYLASRVASITLVFILNHRILVTLLFFFFSYNNHFKLQEFHNWLPGDRPMFDFSLEAMYSVWLLALGLG